MPKVDIKDAHVDGLTKYFITGWVEVDSPPCELLFVQANKIVGKTFPWIRRKDLDDLYGPSKRLGYHHVFKNPKIFGSFCKHVAYPSHSPFVADKIEKHFETMAQMFSSSNFSTSRQESLKYRFFSTNCCLVRRSCLMEHPFPEINYGEDQLWSFTMLENGWGVAFVPDMAVLHSHDYDGDEIREMTRTDLEYHKVHFQEFPVWSQKHLDDETVSISKEINATAQEVHDELRKNKIRMDAYNEARLSKEVSYNK